MLRGSAPTTVTYINQLKDFGVTDVAMLNDAGFSVKRIQHIPFKWQGMGSFQEELTPSFLKMATLIKSGALSAERLDESACDNLR